MPAAAREPTEGLRRGDVFSPKRTFYGIFIPEQLLGCGLKPTDLIVYGLLARYDNGSGRAWPSQELLAEKLGVDSRTVQRSLADLEDAGYIRRERRPGVRRGNQYVFTWVPELVAEPGDSLDAEGSDTTEMQFLGVVSPDTDDGSHHDNHVGSHHDNHVGSYEVSKRSKSVNSSGAQRRERDTTVIRQIRADPRPAGEPVLGADDPQQDDHDEQGRPANPARWTKKHLTGYWRQEVHRVFSRATPTDQMIVGRWIGELLDADYTPQRVKTMIDTFMRDSTYRDSEKPGRRFVASGRAIERKLRRSGVDRDYGDEDWISYPLTMKRDGAPR